MPFLSSELSLEREGSAAAQLSGSRGQVESLSSVLHSSLVCFCHPSSMANEYWQRYYIGQVDNGPQPNYMTAPIVDNEPIRTGIHKGMRRCRLCALLCEGSQCQACAFYFCPRCLQDDTRFCMRAGCVSTFQAAFKRGSEQYLQYVKKRHPEEKGVTHNITFLFDKPEEDRDPCNAASPRIAVTPPNREETFSQPQAAHTDDAASRQTFAASSQDPWALYFQGVRDRASSTQPSQSSGLHRP